MAVDVMVPQVGQGAVAVECRRASLRHAATSSPPSSTDRPRQAVDCERAFLAELGSGCSLPVGAHAVVVGEGELCLRTFLAGATGIYEGVHEGTADEAARVGGRGGRVRPPGRRRGVTRRGGTRRGGRAPWAG